MDKKTKWVNKRNMEDTSSVVREKQFFTEIKRLNSDITELKQKVQEYEILFCQAHAITISDATLKGVEISNVAQCSQCGCRLAIKDKDKHIENVKRVNQKKAEPVQSVETKKLIKKKQREDINAPKSLSLFGNL